MLPKYMIRLNKIRITYLAVLSKILATSVKVRSRSSGQDLLGRLARAIKGVVFSRDQCQNSCQLSALFSASENCQGKNYPLYIFLSRVFKVDDEFADNEWQVRLLWEARFLPFHYFTP
jgi:hypothetical protein